MRIPFFTSGAPCGYHCIYCDQRAITGADQALTVASLAPKVEDYLQTGSSQGTEIAFFGGTFTALPSDELFGLLDEATRLVKKHSLLGIRFSTRPDLLSVALIERLRNAPLVAIELGAQSFFDDVLKKNQRGHDRQILFESTRALQEAGIDVVLQLMLGLDGSDREKDLESIRQALSLGPSGIRLYPTLVIKETELSKRWAEGQYQALDLDEAVFRVADGLELANRAGIPCLRTGLPVDDLLKTGQVLAGPIHPNFGQLVRDEVTYRALAQEGILGMPRVDLFCALGERHRYEGYKKGLLHRLRKEGVHLTVLEDPALVAGDVRMKGR